VPIDDLRLTVILFFLCIFPVSGLCIMFFSKRGARKEDGFIMLMVGLAMLVLVLNIMEYPLAAYMGR
jgi:hypothetical protein